MAGCKYKSSLAALMFAFLIPSCGPSPSSVQEDLPLVNAADQTISNSMPTPPSTPASNGPFGIALGSAIDTVPGIKPMDMPGLFKTATPPKAHPDFETVVLVAYPETGICQIRGIGRTDNNDGAGASIRAKIGRLADALSTKYGAGESISACAGGEVQCQSQFWMMTLQGGERVYGHKWEKQNDAMKDTKIGSIYLVAAAEDISSTYPVLEFHYQDSSRCESAQKALSASAL